MAANKLLKQRISLIIAVIPFLATAIDAFDRNILLFAILNSGAALLNLAALYFIKKIPDFTNSILFFINSLLAFGVSYYYFIDGKKGLPYVWLMVGFLYSIISLNTWRKSIQNKT